MRVGLLNEPAREEHSSHSLIFFPLFLPRIPTVVFRDFRGLQGPSEESRTVAECLEHRYLLSSTVKEYPVAWMCGHRLRWFTRVRDRSGAFRNIEDISVPLRTVQERPRASSSVHERSGTFR